METTNLQMNENIIREKYKISKKLEEIGFNAESNKTIAMPGTKDYKSYDLETLIDALPEFFIREYKSRKDGTIRKFKEELLISKNAIWYRCYDIETSDDANKYWREYGYEKNIRIYSPDDSLANTAGKMLIKLYEAGIINFNK